MNEPKIRACMIWLIQWLLYSPNPEIDSEYEFPCEQCEVSDD